jgi:hypothetical protein
LKGIEAIFFQPSLLLFYHSNGSGILQVQLWKWSQQFSLHAFCRDHSEQASAHSFVDVHLNDKSGEMKLSTTAAEQATLPCLASLSS